MKCGVSRVRITQSEEVEEALTREDIRGLIQKGMIWSVQKKGTSKFKSKKKLEQKKVFRLAGGRMVPKDRKNPNSYKVRRAKVGGYRDYFDDEQLAQIEALFESTMTPVFGYLKTAGIAG